MGNKRQHIKIPLHSNLNFLKIQSNTQLQSQVITIHTKQKIESHFCILSTLKSTLKTYQLCSTLLFILFKYSPC